MSRHLLIVEDSATQRELLASDLRAAGFEVSVARDGQEAIELLQDGVATADLLISDVVMPRLDGLELCRRVKSDSTLPDLPVVLLTSLQDPLDIVRGLEVGADNFLTKPYDADHLVGRVDAILEGRSARQESDDVTYLQLLGQRFAVTAERQQILELLVGAFEDLVHANHQLRERELALAEARTDLARRLVEVELERGRLEAVLDAIPDGVLIVGADGRITDANPAVAEFGIFGSVEEVLGVHVRELPLTVHNEAGRQLSPATWPIVRAYHDGEATTTGTDVVLRTPDGRNVPVTITAAPIAQADTTPTEAVAVVRDVSAWAFHDRLTALPNRALFADRVERALERAGRDGVELALLVVAIDRFSAVNDTLGRDAENAVVQAVAQRLVDLLRTGATVGRLGAGRFGILLDEVVDVTEAARVADGVADAVRRPIRLGDEEVFLTASTGIAVRSDGIDSETLLRQASTALHRATERGGARREVYEERLDVEARERLFLDAALRKAIEQNELVVHFQPVIEAASGRIVETEALVRWQHGERGLIPPGDFIPIAEESGVIVPLGRWVLHEACRQTSRWRAEQSVPDLRVSVNLSARQFDDPQLLDDVAACLEHSGLPADALTLEVTESALIDDPDQAADVLQGLRSLGVKVAIDDFGTGYSSLSYLRKFPLDVLKIDRSFVQQVGVDPQATAIVRVITALAGTLGLEVIAEGIETDDQLQQMRQVGCHFMAGYHLSRPLPAGDLGPRLTARLPETP